MPADLKTRGEVIQWLMFEVANMGPVMAEINLRDYPNLESWVTTIGNRPAVLLAAE